jgi:uncharacterized secreted protein with C-terminal beta-propeller domain
MGAVWVGVDGFGTPPSPVAPVVTPAATPASYAPAVRPPAAAADYGDLYRTVQAMANSAAKQQSDMMVYYEAGAAVPAAGTADISSNRAGFTQTNTQVVGIDEGDLVKTDGSSIFVASGTDVLVLGALGGDTRQLARIDTTADLAANRPADDRGYYPPGSVLDLMVYGSTLVVVVHEYVAGESPIPGSGNTAYVAFEAKETKTLLYDVSDPSQPRRLAILGQSGAFMSSRLQDSILYLVSSYPLAEPGQAVEADPVTFAPCISGPEGVRPLSPDDIAIAPGATVPHYSVVSSLDLATWQRLDEIAVLGRSDTIYMSEANLYLAALNYGETGVWVGQARPVDDVDIPESDNVTEEPSPVTGEPLTTTNIVRIELAGGGLTLAATASISGSLLNQFSLDEYDGQLRAVTTVISAANQWTQETALWVLDRDLQVMGSIPSLVAGESIESVRFAGPIGYVVTFKRVDPLFAIDLSHPGQPRVLSELKIPGFSTYLHPWTDGLLLGLGMNGNQDGFVDGLKLSMYDTADPAAVAELNQLALDFDDAEALYNHKAVLVDIDNGLIGFIARQYGQDGSVKRRYLLASYEPGRGFTVLAELEVTPPANAYDDPTTRGLRIGDFLYVCAPQAVDVYELDDLDRVAVVTP